MYRYLAAFYLTLELSIFVSFCLECPITLNIFYLRLSGYFFFRNLTFICRLACVVGTLCCSNLCGNTAIQNHVFKPD